MNYVLGIFFNNRQFGYAIASWLCMAVLSVLFCIWWNVVDYKTGGDAQKAGGSLVDTEENLEDN